MSVSGSTAAKGLRGNGDIVAETNFNSSSREKRKEIFSLKRERPTRLMGTSVNHVTRIGGDYTETESTVLFPRNCNIDWFLYNAPEGPVCFRVCVRGAGEISEIGWLEPL